MGEDKVEKIFVKGSVTLRCLFVMCTLTMATIVMAATSASAASVGPASTRPSELNGRVICHNMKITNYSARSDPYGNIAFLGMITNNFTKPISSIQILAELYNNKGILIGVENPYPQFGTLNPKETEPFKISSSVSNKTLDHYALVCAGSVQYNFIG